MGQLPPRQAECLRHIEAYLAEHGYPPTIREMCDAMGTASPHGMDCHFKALERKGYIRRTPGVSRGLRVLRSIAGEAG